VTVVRHENSIYGNIAITRADHQLDFWVNGLPLFTTPNPDVAYVEVVAHLPLLYHPSPRRVLLLGEGLGGVLEEVLRHPVEVITYVELDPLIVELGRIYSGRASETLSDPRVQVVNLDGRLFVKGVGESYDVVLLHLPSPSTLQINRFYTLEFFEEVRSLLGQRGVFSLILSSSPAHIPLEMAERNRCIYEALTEVFPHFLVVPGEYNLFVASPGLSLVYDAEELHQRLLERDVETRALTLEYLRYLFDPGRREIGLAYLRRTRGWMNSDDRPLAVFYDLALWNSLINPSSTPLFRLLSRLGLGWLLLPILLSLLAAMRGVKASTPIAAAVLTTGLAGMTISILILYAYQILCGYLYQELGVVSASFMLGLALGGLYMSRRLPRLGSFKTLIKVEVAVAAYILLFPLALELPATPLARWLLPLLSCLAGFLVGLEFPLASELVLRAWGGVGRVAGSLYALDLLGGCLGAVASSIWLIPLHGFWGASLAVAALKACSLLLLLSIRLRRLHLFPAP
jgi:spermidine synthase